MFHALLLAAPPPGRVTGPTLFPLPKKSLSSTPGCLALPANFSIKLNGDPPDAGSAGSVLQRAVARLSLIHI